MSIRHLLPGMVLLIAVVFGPSRSTALSTDGDALRVASGVVGSSQLQPTAVKIVSSLPLTGRSAAEGQAIVNAIQMALAERSGQAGDLTVGYESLDDASPAMGSWSADVEAGNARHALDDSVVVAYIGTFDSGAARVSLPLLNPADLVMVSPANTYPGLTKFGGAPNEPDVYYPTGTRNYARVIAADDVQGKVAARWAKALGAQRLYVLADDSQYGRWLAAIFLLEARNLGLQVVSWDSTARSSPPPLDDRSVPIGTRIDRVNPRAVDYRDVGRRAQQAQADLIYYGGITEGHAGRLWRDLRATVAGSVTLMGPEALVEPVFLDSAGEMAAGTYLTSNGVPVSHYEGDAESWARRYRNRYAMEPSKFAIYGFEATNVVLDGIARAGRADRSAIREAVMSTSDYDGLLGRWGFDRNGDTTLTVTSAFQVQGTSPGHFEFMGLLRAD